MKRFDLGPDIAFVKINSNEIAYNTSGDVMLSAARNPPSFVYFICCKKKIIIDSSHGTSRFRMISIVRRSNCHDYHVFSVHVKRADVLLTV